MDDVVLGKAEIIERCVRRVREVHGGDTEAFLAERTKPASTSCFRWWLKVGCERSRNVSRSPAHTASSRLQHVWIGSRRNSRIFRRAGSASTFRRATGR
jgi:hypothetical protein